MRQRYIWLIVGVVTLSLMLICAATGVIGYVLVRDQVATTLAELDEPTIRELDGSNTSGSRRFELPEPSATPTASAEVSPRATATAEPTPSPSPRASHRPHPSPRPSAAPSPSPTSNDQWTVVYEDDFSDSDSGWYVEHNVDDMGSITYADDTYRMLVTEPDMSLWAIHRSFRLSRLRDVRVEVDATQVDGYVDDTFGIICRYQEDGFYALEVGNDGWYSIGRVDGEEFTLLAAPDFEEDGADDVRDASMVLQDDEDTLRLRADCIGDTLTLYVNGEKIAEVQDDTYTTGGIGLTAYNYDAPRTEILFDNIVISKR
jgi:hypothetical protein